MERDLFELTSRLTRSLVLTPELLHNWPCFLREFSGKLRQIFPFFYLFVGWKEKKGYRVQVFGCCPRAGDKREKLRERIRKTLEDAEPNLRKTRFSFSFQTLEKDAVLPGEAEELSQVCKIVSLRNPAIWAAVGMGLPASGLEHETRFLILENLLSLLLNLVLSVRVMEDYTRHLEFHATRDALTGLYNRWAFREFLNTETARAKRRGSRLAVLFLDVDNLKLINDFYGHEEGDRLLRSLAERISGQLRRGDILARYGGDEFVALLPDTGLQGAFSVARRILKSLQGFSFSTPDGKSLGISCSAGLAVFPDHATDPERLILLADRAMYRAKKKGKRGIEIPSPADLSAEGFEPSGHLLTLLEAVEKRRIIPYFQPIVDLKRGGIFAYEVLMRLETDTGVPLPARRFISLAERMGLLGRMEEILWEKTLEKLSSSWEDFLLFFNVSPVALLRRDFLEHLEELWRKYRFSPEHLVLEITERESVLDLTELRGLARKLRSRGIRFALDDFGSGYSSYRYLRHLPIDFIKIEGEFVRSMHRNEIDRAFVAGAVTLARTLGAGIVAEFVESEELMDELRRLGVDYAQGYWLGKPAPEIRR